jgi:hypothetical protein
VVHAYKSQLFQSQRQEDCEFGASLGKVSKTLSQKQKYTLKGQWCRSSGKIACLACVMLI